MDRGRLSRVVEWLRGSRASPPAPNFGRVAPWLLVGPALDETGYAFLANEGVTHIVDMRREASDDPDLMESLHLHFLRVPVRDRAAPTSAQLAEINAWLDGAGEPQPIVYLHCEGGLGRSPTIAIALLMQRGFSRLDAHRLVIGARAVASPTENQHGWLAEVERELAEAVSSESEHSRS